MERAFAQRREQVVGDLVQLKTDVDAYNDMNGGDRPPIQIPLDFAEDVAERMVDSSLLAPSNGLERPAEQPPSRRSCVSELA